MQVPKPRARRRKEEAEADAPSLKARPVKVDAKTAEAAARAALRAEFDRKVLADHPDWKERVSAAALEALRTLYVQLQTNKDYRQTPENARFWVETFMDRETHSWPIPDEKSPLEGYGFNADQMLALVRLAWEAQKDPHFAESMKTYDARNGGTGQSLIRYVLTNLRTELKPERDTEGRLVPQAENIYPTDPHARFYRMAQDSLGAQASAIFGLVETRIRAEM